MKKVTTYNIYTRIQIYTHLRLGWLRQIHTYTHTHTRRKKVRDIMSGCYIFLCAPTSKKIIQDFLWYTHTNTHRGERRSFFQWKSRALGNSQKCSLSLSLCFVQNCARSLRNRSVHVLVSLLYIYIYVYTYIYKGAAPFPSVEIPHGRRLKLQPKTITHLRVFYAKTFKNTPENVVIWLPTTAVIFDAKKIGKN